MANYIDKDHATNNHPVMALVTARDATYVICRGEGAAAEVKNHLQDMAPAHVTSPEAWRVIPEQFKSRYHISSGSIIKLPEASLGSVVLSLTQDASGSPSNQLLSENLQDAALKASSKKGWAL